MARSLNRATIIGNLGKDPELRSTPSGTPVCTIRVATTDSYKNKDGNLIEQTDWHSVVLWERLAEIASHRLKKGSKVYIEGKIKNRNYEKDGVTRFVTEIRATSMIIMSEVKNGDGDYHISHEEFEEGFHDEHEVPF